MVLEVEWVDEHDPRLAEIPRSDTYSALRVKNNIASGIIIKKMMAIRPRLKFPDGP
jgi:hypothetical protein